MATANAVVSYSVPLFFLRVLFVLFSPMLLGCSVLISLFCPLEQENEIIRGTHLNSGDKQPVFRTSSAEKRRYCESKRSTSSSSSCSSDDELKELRDVSLPVQRTHIRHKPPLKDRRIISISNKDSLFDSQDDDEVFLYNKSGFSKRSKLSHHQPLSGRYMDFDKMRRAPLTQVPKVCMYVLSYMLPYVCTYVYILALIHTHTYLLMKRP